MSAYVQEALATAKMVELAGGGGMDAEAMEREMQANADGMKRVLEMADALRLETMRGVVALLRPAQAVHFLLAAAAELHLAVHDFGLHPVQASGGAVRGSSARRGLGARRAALVPRSLWWEAVSSGEQPVAPRRSGDSDGACPRSAARKRRV